MNITPEERDKAIEAILDEGLVKPVPTHSFIKNMYRNLGLRVIFWEAFPGLLCSVVFTALYILMLFLLLGHVFDAYAFVFLLSPAMFVALTVSTEAIERTNGLYELKMTGKYTIRQTSALRLLIFSMIGTIFTIVGCLALYIWLTTSIHAPDLTGTIYLINLISLALSSLFLCTLLVLYVMRRWHSGWYAGALIWTALSVLPILFFEQTWSTILSNLPPVIALCIAAVALVLFLREVDQTTREGRNYAYSR